LTDEVMVLTADSIGKGDDSLGRVLMANFLRFQSERTDPVQTIILMNSAVKLACKDGADFEAQEYLRHLASSGTHVLSCRTCLEHFGLLEAISVGEIGGMKQFVEMMRSGRVVTL
jgi:hypothetical protein